MKIVCPCRNLRLGKTVRDAENRSRAEVLYHLRPTHAYLVERSANNANQREKYMDEGFTTRESRHPLDRPCSIFHCLYFYWSNFSLVGLYITLKLAQKHMKSPFFVVNSRPYCHCRSFVEKSCLLSQIYFMRCRYFLGHVACRNLPWQGLNIAFSLCASWTLEGQISGDHFPLNSSSSISCTHGGRKTSCLIH